MSGLLGLAAALPPVRAIRYTARVFRRFAYPDQAPSFETPEDYGLSAESFEVTAEDGVRIRGWLFEPPDARGVVIVCHPRSSNKSRVLRHIQILVEGGMAVVVFDFRACGDSERPGRRVFNSMWEPLRDLEAVARMVEQRFAGDAGLGQRVALLGCSFGGNMAIAHAGTTGRCYAALVLDSTPLIHWQDMLDLLLARERRGARRRVLRAIGDYLAVRLLVAWTRTEALYRHAQRSAQCLDRTPLLLMLGERDGYFDIEQSCRFVAESYAGPVELWRVPRGRHLTLHITAAEEYSRRLLDFLDRAFDNRAARPPARQAACAPARPSARSPARVSAASLQQRGVS
ncbi:alpha/beta hydrolase [Haliangium sp.]|uniref:alpha/beta hydrolase n=1 Tax=Haliangium sp. TaxID=2663208 RepID=UPI003D0C1914